MIIVTIINLVSFTQYVQFLPHFLVALSFQGDGFGWVCVCLSVSGLGSQKSKEEARLLRANWGASRSWCRPVLEATLLGVQQAHTSSRPLKTAPF